MISPAEILNKSKKLYPKAIKSWLAAEDIFPHTLRAADLNVNKLSTVELIAQVQELLDGSKEKRGFGYRVQQTPIQSRKHGNNLFPTSIFFDSLEDLARFIGKKSELEQLKSHAQRLREELAVDFEWLHRNWKALVAIDSQCLEELISIVHWIKKNPLPGCYVREIPLPISTKVVENNRNLLTELLYYCLPETAIDFGSTSRDFERQFGFRKATQLLRVRLLDDSLRSVIHVPWLEFGVSARDMQTWQLENARIVIVENKTNLLAFETLPALPNTLALGGLGNNLSEYKKLSWLNSADLAYWGDVDPEGLKILADFRHAFPHARSLFMDEATLSRYQHLWTPRKEPSRLSTAPPPLLTPQEAAAYRRCLRDNIRLEQEHIPQIDVVSALNADSSR